MKRRCDLPVLPSWSLVNAQPGLLLHFECLIRFLALVQHCADTWIFNAASNTTSLPERCSAASCLAVTNTEQYGDLSAALRIANPVRTASESSVAFFEQPASISNSAGAKRHAQLFPAESEPKESEQWCRNVLSDW